MINKFLKTIILLTVLSNTTQAQLYTSPFGDYLIKVALGEVEGESLNDKFGSNPLVGASETEDVWASGGIYSGQLTTTAETIEVVSTSGTDDVGSTGMDTVIISGLDASWNPQNDTIALNGTSAVTTTNTYLRVNRAWAKSTGSGLENVGTITATGSSSSTVYAAIPAGANQSRVAAFTVPAGKKALILSYSFRLARTNGSAGSTTFNLKVKYENDTFYRIQKNHVMTDAAPVFIEPYKYLPEKTDVKVEVTDGSDASNSVSASIVYILKDMD